MPLCDQATVEAEADAWAARWNEHHAYQSEVVVFGTPPLSTLMPEMLLQAASTFPAASGVGTDNVSPRDLCRLSKEAIRCLCMVLSAAELLGSWPECLHLVLIVLLQKPDCGRRPIGLFPTIIRVWMRARVYVAREWEAANQRSCLYGGPSMGAQRASWQASFAAETVARSGKYFAQSLLDLVTAFEMIPHHLIVSAARTHGFSPWFLRLSLAAYRLPRAIGVEGVYSRLIVASRGITAGSGFATTELRILLLDIVDQAYQLFPSLELAVYVDDITPYYSGYSPSAVVQRVARAADFFVDTLQKEYLLEVSTQKSYVLASSMKLAQRVAAASLSGKLAGKRSGKLFGAPIGGGRRRNVRTLKKMLHDFRGKAHCIQALRRAGVRVATIVRAAGTPAVTYGVECTGAGNSHLQAMRSTIASAAAPEGGDKNLDLVLFALDTNTGTLDPAFDAHVLPLKFWAFAVWEQWRSADDLHNAVQSVRSKLGAARSPWSIPLLFSIPYGVSGGRFTRTRA